MSAPPVRVVRTGWRQVLPLTREEVKRACVYAEEWVRPTTWKDVEDLMHGLAWQIGEQLGRPINALLVGVHDLNDMPVLRVHVGEFQHHIVIRDTRLLENNAGELLVSDRRVEQVVEQRLEALKAQADLKAARTKEWALGSARPRHDKRGGGKRGV